MQNNAGSQRADRLQLCAIYGPRDRLIHDTPRQSEPRIRFVRMKPLKQIAALPYVETESGLLVLLITTRSSGRWTIPKGWPKPGISNAEMAAREAFEEAGISGQVSSRSMGSFLYTKRLHLFSWARCNVEVYLLHTLLQHLHWPEKESRRTLWVEPGKAASMVRESQLAMVLRGFDSSAMSL